MLQEVHCSEGTMDIWTCEWGYKALFSGCSSSKAGVCILFNNNFNPQIHKVFSDPNGRFIICDIVAESKHLTVANIYAPNENDPNFFNSFFDHLSSFRGEDFNLVLDVEKRQERWPCQNTPKSMESDSRFLWKSWFDWYLETFKPRGQEIYLAPKQTELPFIDNLIFFG